MRKKDVIRQTAGSFLLELEKRDMKFNFKYVEIENDYTTAVISFGKKGKVKEIWIILCSENEIDIDVLKNKRVKYVCFNHTGNADEHLINKCIDRCLQTESILTKTRNYIVENLI